MRKIEPTAGSRQDRGNGADHPVTARASDAAVSAAPRPGSTIVLLAGLTLLLFALRVSGPSDLTDNDQERPAAYVMDVVLHGHWWCQTDWTGEVMSKPPLFTWIAALATLAAGHANLWSLYFPGLVAIALTVVLLFLFGRNRFGWAAGFLAGLLYLVSPAGAKHIALARTDGLFAATVALTGLLGFLAWQRGRGWTGFWLAAALATLTKGPLGVLLGSMGMLAVIWERFDRRSTGRRHDTRTADVERASRLGPAHLIGIALFLTITLGWFWLAYQQCGQGFIAKVVGRELVAHVVSPEHGSFGIGFVKAPFYWLTRFLPWSIVALVGLLRVWMHPAADEMERRFERFLFCWLLGGLLIFSLATHQRGDLPLPLDPPAALLAGREIARWLRHWTSKQLLLRALATAVLVFGAYAPYLHVVFARTSEARRSEGIQSLARRLAGDSSLPPLLHVDDPYALQFHLNAMNRAVSFEAAARALAAEQPRSVALTDVAALRSAVGGTTTLYRLSTCSASEKDASVTILSNRPADALRCRR